MKKLIVLIFLFVSVVSVAQYNDWSAVKIGTNDMSRIYVGSNLVWESCEYGNLDEYTIINVWYRSEGVTFTSVQDMKDALDYSRSNPAGYTGVSAAYKTFTVGASLLNVDLLPVVDVILCEAFDHGQTYYINGVFATVGNSVLLTMNNEIITAVEYY